MKEALNGFEKNAYKYMAAFFGTWALQLMIGITVRNPFTVVLFVCIFLLAKWEDGFSYTGKNRVVPMLLCYTLPTALAALITALNFRRLSGQFTSGFFKLLTAVILFCGSFMLLVVLTRAALVLIKKELFVKKTEEVQERRSIPATTTIETRVFLITALVCFLGYLPYYLYEFPGIMTADSLVQFEQIIGVTPYSNHHPVIHTLTIKLFYELGYRLIGDNIGGIACYTLFQMIFIALCSAVCVREIVRIEKRVVFSHVIPAVIFLAFVPFNAVFAVTVWKDVPFAGIAVLLACHLVEMYRRRDESLKISDFIGFFILAVLFMLFRSNAFYAMIVFAVFFVIAFRKKTVAAVATAVAAIVLTFLIKGPVFDAYHIIRPDFVESLSVPLQQVAGALTSDGKVTDEQLSLIDAVIDRTYVKELYAPNYADNIKELVRAGHPEVLEANKGKYLGLWWQLFCQNPGRFVKAWYDLEGGYINPDVAYAVGDVDGIMGNNLGLYSMPIIGGKFIKVKEILLKLGDFMPIYGMLFSIGAYCWGLILTLVVAFRKKRNGLIHILMLLLIGTLLIAAPVVDFRYGYAYVLSSPLWLVAALVGEEYE